MNKTILNLALISFFLLISITGKAQSPEVPETMIWSIDSLLSDWKTQEYLNLDKKECKTSAVNPHFPDSVYISRLSRIPSIMEMPYNPIVRKFIDLYTEKLRTQVSIMLSSTNFYIPIFEEALDTYNLPIELKYLPIIESALNPTAVSRAGATGLWQFMLRTGKKYGLEISSLVDERRDPIKSTWAAAQYLKDLHDMYNDWNLVIAAYNCGPGNVNKAIRRAGGSTDYWAIYDYLPRETRGYVPAFIAANYVMTYYCDHNICPVEGVLPTLSDTVLVNQDLHLDQISAICDVKKEELRSLNPQYKRDIVPGNTQLSSLRLPQDVIATFIENQDTIYNYNRDSIFKKRKTVKAGSTAVHSKPSAKTTYYKIQRGDNLSTIARKHGVSVAKLREWNGLKNDNIRAGKTLKIIR
ncbi:MAG: transglycosylase SLT domain-containing protein [Bacteroides sp.]